MKRSHVPGTIYLICTATQPYKHAQHYLGWTERSVLDRLAEHVSGHGSPLVNAICRQLGIRTPLELQQIVVTMWPGLDRCTERLMKGRGGKARVCPVCRARAGIVRPYRPYRCPKMPEPAWQGPEATHMWTDDIEHYHAG